MADAICAVATGNGHSAIGIIRLSGNESRKYLLNIFFPLNTSLLKQKNLSHMAVYGHIKEKGQTIDDVLVLFFDEGKSYTGEESAEIHCHGNPIIIEKILQLLFQEGFRMANPGEFTYRAYLSGRIDLNEAEAIREIIEARSERHLQKAILKKEGHLKKKILELRTSLLNITADITAELDFSDEGLEFVSRDEKVQILSKIYDDLSIWLETSNRFQVYKNGLEFVLVGAPNAGKSSLLNILSGKNRAIVSDIPGTTRDYIEASLEIKGVPVVFIDTAGIRGSDFDAIEKMGMEKTLEKFQESDLRLIIIDSSYDIKSIDFSSLTDFFKFAHIHKTVLVLNKWDIHHEEWDKLLEEENIWNVLFKDNDFTEELYFPEVGKNVFKISALTGFGLNDLQKRFEEVIDKSLPHNDYIVLSVWQTEVMEKIRKTILETSKIIKEGAFEELVVENLNEILELLSEFTGEITSDEILGRIFSRFCIGK